MKTSLRVNILASFTTLIVLSTLLLLTNFYFQSSEAARALSEKIGAEMSDKVIGQIQAYLTPAINGTMLTAKRIQREEIGRIDEEGLWRSMWDMLMNAPQLESLYVATADGRFWQSRRKPEWTTRFLRVGSAETLERWFLRDEDYRLKSIEDKKTTYDPRQRPWYLSTTAAMKVNWSDIYIFKTVKRPGLTATFPVVRDGKLTAVVAADISLASISEFLARQSVSEHGFILIVDERNEVVAFGDQEKTVQATADGKGLRTSRVSDLGLGWL
ncbi:MAG: cache domain-containing protein, partial [Deltaproteobacteria bacterium]|nr:cache domain-containing protein [Deltaproteobacteria bacterium]